MYNLSRMSFSKTAPGSFLIGLLLIAAAMLSGCSNTESNDPNDPNKGRYSLKNDTAPKSPISVEHIDDADPKYEPYSRGGNRNYTLRDKHYTIIQNPEGFSEQGQASWYGKKFHGHLTANGEIYDMYSMTGAHKTLPIPSYVKVTNLDNNKTTTVRINDRGPFHKGRIIDLSYAAAYKLGVLENGSANVKIDVITVPPESNKPLAEAHNYVIQVSASKDKQQSDKLSKKLSQHLSVNSYLEDVANHYRVFLGPFSDYKQAKHKLEEVKALGYSSAFIKKP